MEKQPEEITVCQLEVVVMPNGEVICLGKTVGWFKELGKFLKPATDKETLKQKFYANSPFDLASDNDNLYRDAVDETLGA